VASGNGAVLVDCAVAGDDVVVTVQVDSPELAGHTFRITGRARAGPAPVGAGAVP